jgi:hypothetical protein
MNMLPKIDFRCPQKLMDAIKREAERTGLSPGQVARRACEKMLGVEVEVKKGIGAADEKTRKRVEKARMQGIKRRAKEQSHAP